MECNKDEAIRAKAIADIKLEKQDFQGAKKFAQKAQSLYPQLDGLSQMLSTIDVYISASNKISGEVDWYGVLGINPTADDETLRKQYRKLALLLHPDKNKSPGADGAFKLICEAWSLLSDKAKRLAYNQRRSPKGFPQNVSVRTSSPSAPPQTNGFHNFVGRTSTAPKAPRSNAQVPSTSVPRPLYPRTDTFWTICRQCKMHYEYLKVYLNRTLLCPNCHQAFLASEAAPPFNYQNSSNSAVHRQQNLSNRASVANSFNPRRNAGTAAKVPGSAALNSSSSTNFPQDPQSRTTAVGGVDPSIATKAANVVQQAQERMKRAGRDGYSGYNSAPAGHRPYKRAHFDGDDHQFRSNIAHNRASVDGFSSVKSTSAERKSGFQPGYSSTFNQPKSTRELTPIEMRNMLMDKARKGIVEKLNEWRFKTPIKDVYGGRKTKKSEKGKRNTILGEGHELNGSVDSSGILMADQAEKPACDVDVIGTENPSVPAMSVPDPDFHDFDKDRTESCFGDNEVWAGYDDDDGMPRFYAMISKVVSSKPFKIRISWLNSKITSEFGSLDWVGSGFYKTCGEFRLGRYELNKSINSFSHKVQWSKGPRGVIHIFPKRGDVWALYRDWAPDWNEQTPDEVIHKYDMVVILDDYIEEQGVSVAPLVKVAGFKTVFLPHSDPEKILRIPKEEMFRFSHQVPHYELMGEEAPNAPKGCLELDPAATPLELLEVLPETGNGNSKEEMLQKSPDNRDDKVDGATKKGGEDC